jgi:hypothetical protein
MRAGGAITPALLISRSTGAVDTRATCCERTSQLAAYDSDPELASMRLDFTATLRDLLALDPDMDFVIAARRVRAGTAGFSRKV